VISILLPFTIKVAIIIIAIAKKEKDVAVAAKK
jgi:hypothetical protein